MSRTEIVGWVLAILVVAVMGVIVFTGPYKKVNKPQAAAASSSRPTQSVKIADDPKTIGRYTPASVTLHVGDKVKFTNDSSAIHTVTANNQAFNSGDINTNSGTWTYTAKSTGTFKYYCIYHPLMKGQIVVQS
jgi:plastocyanin